MFGVMVLGSKSGDNDADGGSRGGDGSGRIQWCNWEY